MAWAMLPHGFQKNPGPPDPWPLQMQTGLAQTLTARDPLGAQSPCWVAGGGRVSQQVAPSPVHPVPVPHSARPGPTGPS